MLEAVRKKIKDYGRNLILTTYRFLSRVQGKTIVHFFHIGKTGGTSIKFALKYKIKPFVNKSYIIFCHNHAFGLRHTLIGEKVFFFTRDPVDRFVSGFYSRKRKGMPRFYSGWTPKEKEAFEKFNTPNELAISLSDKNKVVRKEAVDAMKSIAHVRSLYWDWFGDLAQLQSRLDDIIFVGTQKRLDEDFTKLKEILGISKEFSLPTEQNNMHKNSKNYDTYLSAEAVENLKKWYSKDFEFLEILDKNNLIRE